MNPIIYRIEHKDTGEVHEGTAFDLAKIIGGNKDSIRYASVHGNHALGYWKCETIEKLSKKPKTPLEQTLAEAEKLGMKYGDYVAMTEYGMKIER